jgi:DNA ligase-1
LQLLNPGTFERKIGLLRKEASPMPDQASAKPSLILEHVNTVLTRIGKTSGTGSSLERKQLLGALLADATPEEQQFLARLLLGELRQGALEGVMVEAIAKATQISRAEVRRALMVTGDLPLVTKTAFIEGAGGLRHFKVQLLKPLQPMLAQSAQDVTEALTQLGSAAIEYKLDGARIQVHKRDQDIRIFTRKRRHFCGKP